MGPASSHARRYLSHRVVQLAIMVIAQLVSSNLQYAWTLFVDPIDAQYHWGRASIQVAFSVLVFTQAFLMPAAGYLADRMGPRLLMALGGVFAGLAWVTNASASSLPMLYLGGLLGGLAYGSVSGAAMAHVLKCFPDRRGLTVGLASGAFAIGAVLTAVPIANMVQGLGYETTFLRFGLAFGGILLMMAALLCTPHEEGAPAAAAANHRVPQSTESLIPSQVLSAPVFYLLYVIFTLVCIGGLIVVAQMGLMAKDFKLATVPVSLVGITLVALPFALSLSRMLDGLGRPFFGWVSDHLGRETTMVTAFSTEAAGIGALLLFGHIPVMFVILSGVVLFAWGQIFTLFPALVGDLFGRKFAATNWGLLWTGKGVASLLVPVGSWLVVKTGAWTLTLVLAVLFNIVAALLALFVLKPLCHRMLSRGVNAMERRVGHRRVVSPDNWRPVPESGHRGIGLVPAPEVIPPFEKI